MADHPAKLDYFGVEVIASFVAASVGDMALLLTFPALFIFPIGLPIVVAGIGIHWFCGVIVLGSLWSKLGLSGDLKEAALAATVGAGGEALAKGASKGAAKGLDISAPLRYGSSAFLALSVAWPFPAPSPFPLMTGLIVAVLLHNKLIDFVVAQLGIVALGIATGGAGFAAEGAAVGAEGGAIAAEGAAAAAEAGAAASEAAEGIAAAGRAGSAAERAVGGAEKAAAGTAKELPKGALGETETPFEELERMLKETPQGEKSEEVAEDEEKRENKEGEEEPPGEIDANLEDESRNSSETANNDESESQNDENLPLAA